MGINTLLPFLKQVTVKSKLESFKGQTAAVDASCWMHKGLAISISQTGDDRILQNLLITYVALLERNRIKPFIVFDGLPLPAKEAERIKRTRQRDEIRNKAMALQRNGERTASNKLLAGAADITYAMTTKFITFCREKRIDYIVAPYEADAQIAYLLKNGYADFAISEDSDLLAFGCEKVLYKLQMTQGICDYIQLNDVLKYLGMTDTNFINMCVIAGCDYLPNIRGIGINKAKKLVKEETNLMNALLKLRNCPEDYASKFMQAKAVFLHQTVIDIKSSKTMPLKEWEDLEELGTLQNLCGKEYSVNIAAGNVNPKQMDVILNTFQLPTQQSREDQTVISCTVSDNEINQDASINTSGMEVIILSIDDAWFPWIIPSFPVMTVNLRKIKFITNGKECNGVVNKDVNIQPRAFICTSHCTIQVDNEDFTVLWVLSPSKSQVQHHENPQRDAPRLEDETEPNFEGNHTLPFKVLGTCYWTSRQAALEEAYEHLYEHNRPIFVNLVEEPENLHDSNAIAVYITVSDEKKKVGYIPRELTIYLKPILKHLEASVKNIRFSTSYYTMGFYITIEITKQGMWHKNVIEASKKVK